MALLLLQCLHTTSEVEKDYSHVDSFDKDLAAAIVPEYAQDFGSDTETRVLKKLDLFLIPWMWIGYGFVYHDKAILSSAVDFGMTNDLSVKVMDTSTNPRTTVQHD